MAIIKVGDAYSLGAVNEFSITPDDRQTTIQTMGGNVVQDYGVVDSGEKLTCTATFKQGEAEKVFDYWKRRVLVDVVDVSGKTWTARRVVIPSWSYVDKFPDVYSLQLEFWGV